MKTISCPGGMSNADHQEAGSKLRFGPACDQSAANWLRLAIQQKPLLRNSPRSWSSTAARRAGWNGRSAVKVRLRMPYSSVSGTCPPASSSVQPSDAAASTGL
ncbi:Uncharacterised protein [Mycobacteroides abscessus subsp. abscessus]|nr:Uncharacterised protein [Mycobacteroides abscessus subsp. abscessus]